MNESIRRNPARTGRLAAAVALLLAASAQGADFNFDIPAGDLKAALDASYFRSEEGLVRDFMSTDVVAVSTDATLIDAIQIFVSSNFSRLPVVEGARLVGQISRHDILRGLERLR